MADWGLYSRASCSEKDNDLNALMSTFDIIILGQLASDDCVSSFPKCLFSTTHCVVAALLQYFASSVVHSVPGMWLNRLFF